MGKKMVTNSLKQDESGDIALSDSSRKIAIPFLMIFAYIFTVFVVDFLLAIDSKWFSTMFGVYCFAGIFVSGFACLSIVTVQIKKNGELKKAAPKHILKDLGTYTMGFSAFFAYIGFSQFMLVWYANMPAETFYFMERSQNGWDSVFLLIPLCKFIIPFVFLMPWGMRSNPICFQTYRWNYNNRTVARYNVDGYARLFKPSNFYSICNLASSCIFHDFHE